MQEAKTFVSAAAAADADAVIPSPPQQETPGKGDGINEEGTYSASKTLQAKQQNTTRPSTLLFLQGADKQQIIPQQLNLHMQQQRQQQLQLLQQQRQQQQQQQQQMQQQQQQQQQQLQQQKQQQETSP
ncbi:hypothetical protein EPH_0056070 [Eimeria praecox]|uniref:Uncharacterized protein n=1 Tax=Eimeria praecox TaxID=51316 RepID=U6GSI1_9EIME|nr:hypothetical protein EPH_0056070 [Eimeria praecox]